MAKLKSIMTNKNINLCMYMLKQLPNHYASCEGAFLKYIFYRAFNWFHPFNKTSMHIAQVLKLLVRVHKMQICSHFSLFVVCNKLILELMKQHWILFVDYVCVLTSWRSFVRFVYLNTDKYMYSISLYMHIYRYSTVLYKPLNYVIYGNKVGYI